MNAQLDKVCQRSRLSLSIEAMKMFISRLKDDDMFGVVLFDTLAQVLIKPILKKNMT